MVAKVGDRRSWAPTAQIGENGSTTFLGFRPRDDQAASLGAEVRTWFEILLALGAYPGSRRTGGRNDQPQRGLAHDPLRGVPVSQRHHEPRGALSHARRELAGRVPSRRQTGPGNPRPKTLCPPPHWSFANLPVNGHRVTLRGRSPSRSDLMPAVRWLHSRATTARRSRWMGGNLSSPATRVAGGLGSRCCRNGVCPAEP